MIKTRTPESELDEAERTVRELMIAIEDQRIEKGMSSREFSAKSGLSAPAYWAICKAAERVQASTLVRLAKVAGFKLKMVRAEH